MSVSIHAPHEGERQFRADCSRTVQRFQSTLPTRGSDNDIVAQKFTGGGFQSTLPTRGSDRARGRPRNPYKRFNPRSPRGGATVGDAYVWGAQGVSIHAPHEGERLSIRIFGRTLPIMFQSTLPTRGSDSCIVAPNPLVTSFNPRSPRGGATKLWTRRKRSGRVSIHAPHEGERPYLRPRAKTSNTCFNPRSPRGGATYEYLLCTVDMLFQSTLPTRGSDQFELSAALATGQFQSTLPTRGSDESIWVDRRYENVSIHAPHEGERRYLANVIFQDGLFQSTLPTRGSDERGRQGNV